MNRLQVSLESIQHVASLTLDLDLSVPGLVCLVGRNGAGKTTLVRALRNLASADTFVRTATPYAFSPASRITYVIDGAEVVFAYDDKIRSLNCRGTIPLELRNLIAAELPMPHGTRFNYFKSASDADLDIRRVIALGNHSHPEELVSFLAAIYGSTRYSSMVEVIVKGKSYYAIVKGDGTYIREDYLSSGEYFLINFYRTIKGSAQLIVIDEIDISLDAAAQANLTEWLRAFCARYERKILFTTHSLAVMRQLEENELFYVDESNGHISISPTSYSYAKARLFGFSGWDRYILTEDEVLLGFIEAVIEKYCPKTFFRYKIIFIGRAPAATHMTSIVIVLFLIFKAKQFGAILVGGGGKQPLGLDAGLARSVQPEEIEGDVAYQCEVVGDMTAATAGVIVAELNIEAPMQTVLDLPVTAYGMSDFLGVRGEAADVVLALDGGPLANRARALDHGEASDVAPLLGFVEPISDLESLTAADLFAPMAARVRLACAHRDQRRFETDVGQKNGFEQLRMIVLHAQHVVALTLADLVGNRRLRAHRIDGHDAVFDVERAQQLRDRGDLVGLLGGRRLPEHDAHFGREGADHVQRCGCGFAGRAPARLAVDGDHLIPPQRRNHRAHPGPKRPLKTLRVEQRKDPLERVRRGNTVLQPQESAQPVEFGPPPLRDVLEIVGAAQHRTHRHSQQFAQHMPRLLRVAPVLEPFEHFDHRRQFFRFHGSAKKPGNYTKSAPVNRGFVSA